MTFNPLVRATLAPGALLLGGLLLVSGCGGGGGASVPTGTPISTPTPIPGLIFSDEFNASSLDTAKWSVGGRDGNIQRTEFGNQPTFSQDPDGTGFMRVKLDTYLPDDAARAKGTQQFYGTEVAANQKIALSGGGIEYQARMRLSNPERTGLVGSFFMFGSKGNFGGTPPLSFDEVDHELLTNAFVDHPPYTWTNIYNDFRVPQPGVEGGDHYDDLSKTNGVAEPLIPNYNGGVWNTYRIVWQANQVQWFINDQLIRTDTSGRVPNDPMGVRFNLWAPAGPPIGWAAAFNDTLKPAATPDANQTYTLDVDWVRVRDLSATTSNGAHSAAALRLIPASREELKQAGAGYQSNGGR